MKYVFWNAVGEIILALLVGFAYGFGLIAALVFFSRVLGGLM